MSEFNTSELFDGDFSVRRVHVLQKCCGEYEGALMTRPEWCSYFLITLNPLEKTVPFYVETERCSEP